MGPLASSTRPRWLWATCVRQQTSERFGAHTLPRFRVLAQESRDRTEGIFSLPLIKVALGLDTMRSAFSANRNLALRRSENPILRFSCFLRVLCWRVHGYTPRP